MDSLNYLNSSDPTVIEQFYEQYLNDPKSVEPGWRKFFEGFQFAQQHYQSKQSDVASSAEFKVINLITGYRRRGHLFTQTNPVRTRRQYRPTLDIENFGLTQKDLDSYFNAGEELGLGKTTLRKIVEHLEQTYCQSVGAEFFYIRIGEIYEWLRSRMEGSRNTPVYTIDARKKILNNLSKAVFFEKFLHRKFPGQKRFSLEGAESLIPALNAVIEKGALLGSEEFVIGMAHRGRLNVLTNILQKPVSDIFSEFEGKDYDDDQVMGDVKYHLGFTTTYQMEDGKDVKVSLAPNPSHLEAVNPVVEGIVKAMLDHDYDGNIDKITPILIHGDASVAGQGIIYEVLQMSELPGYLTGGTIHLVINNQIGFTTNYLEARSSTYCTDIAKTIQTPVFHVNGDDVEAVVYTVQLAMEYRAQFHKDVFIDLLCYRRYGHNEGDEPRFTQPILYKIIENHPDPREIYSRKLIEQGVITPEESKLIEATINDHLDNSLTQSRATDKSHVHTFFEQRWRNIRKAETEDFVESIPTGVSSDLLVEIGMKLTSLPADKQFYRKLVKIQDERRAMIVERGNLDWALGELLAYATLLDEGFPVRLSGQDSQRGTFSHRHSVFTVEDSEEHYTPLKNISERQAKFQVINSLLSEYGVLGFEYGYALTTPNGLTIWEAQFGDFNNGAQIITDQYISSAEDKWKVMNGVVLLLPHGYEGQGPEHSSARIERFLTLCADNNMQVANCTTPSNFFHLLRRQLHREFRKPLIVFTPKSLLRHEKCVSAFAEFTTGGFKEVIDDDTTAPETITRLVFCMGKVYYDLLDEKKRIGDTVTAIIRIEQMYPFPIEQLNVVISRYNNAAHYLWVQEEPANMGSWSFIQRHFKDVPLLLIARPESGSPATGLPKLHKLRQQKIVQKAFGECTCERVESVCKMICAPREEIYLPAEEK
ncbi:MAG: 2-oxoglutarate dehydrogenase E1 component [Bacteroidetes bacterium]|nr:2-oxoglutarate dehydrogenase E1 component [Bacteroidota bacterium]